MDPAVIAALILFGMLAGILGTMFGLGGGMLLVPVLTILYGLSAADAAAVSLAGIVAASAGGASQGIRKRKANIRLGLLLEIPTAIGAVIGAAVAAYMEDVWLMILFAAVMIYSGIRMALGTERRGDGEDYEAKNVPSGMAVCGAAGMMASMTGVGGGMIKVPLMNLHMGIPIKAAAATSSYMIGITAFSGAIVYFMSGTMLTDYAASVAAGAFIGSFIGSAISSRIGGNSLKRYFALFAFAMAVSVLLRAGGMI